MAGLRMSEMTSQKHIQRPYDYRPMLDVFKSFQTQGEVIDLEEAEKVLADKDCYRSWQVCNTAG
jgi:hypothetical protein